MIEEHKRKSEIAKGSTPKFHNLIKNKEDAYDLKDNKSNGNAYDASGMQFFEGINSES